jgi:hypothetical protein
MGERRGMGYPLTALLRSDGWNLANQSRSNRIAWVFSTAMTPGCVLSHSRVVWAFAFGEAGVGFRSDLERNIAMFALRVVMVVFLVGVQLFG